LNPSRILWVAATAREAAVVPPGNRVVVSGVGAASAALRLGLALQRQPADLVVGVGVAGAFPASGLVLGQVVAVASEAFMDLGAEDGDRHLDLWSLGFDPGHPSRYELRIPDACADLVAVRAGTCSLCTGTESTRRLREEAGFQLESMEGAAWAMACWQQGVPFCELRSISNFCGPRDRLAWRLDDALLSLKRHLEESWVI